jgi:hypothetical protein
MIEKLELLALKSVAIKDYEYFCRKVYRYYSEKFHTPLAEVHNLSWAFVFTHYMEHVIENNNSQEEINELVLSYFYPEMKKVKNFMGEFDNEEEELQAYINKIEKEEEHKKQTKKQNPHINEPDIVMESSSFEHLENEMEDENE